MSVLWHLILLIRQASHALRFLSLTAARGASSWLVDAVEVEAMGEASLADDCGAGVSDDGEGTGMSELFV